MYLLYIKWFAIDLYGTTFIYVQLLLFDYIYCFIVIVLNVGTNDNCVNIFNRGGGAGAGGN